VDEPRLLTTEQVAQQMQVTPTTVVRMIEDGQLEAHDIARSGKPRYRVSGAALERYLASRVVTPKNGQRAVAS
jgi:excisionase family DNA binding protein